MKKKTPPYVEVDFFTLLSVKTFSLEKKDDGWEVTAFFLAIGTAEIHLHHWLIDTENNFK